MFQDLRYGVRMLLKQPGFACVAILTLGLGIGANTALFSLLDAVLLKMLPVKQPQALILFDFVSGMNFIGKSFNGHLNLAAEQATGNAFSYATFKRFQTQPAPLTDVFAFTALDQLNVNVDGQAEVTSGQVVSGNYFAGLGVPFSLGRALTEADDQETANPVAVLSYRYWQRRFGRDPAVLGKVIHLNGVAFQIIGVTAPGFASTLQVGNAPDFTLPLAMEPRIAQSESQLRQPGHWWLQIMARLKPGAQPEQARASLAGIFQQSAIEEYQALPATEQTSQKKPDIPQLGVQPGSQGLDNMRRAYEQPLLILQGLVGLVLAVACASVANLLLARAAMRQKEIAVRLAVGANRWRVIRQLLTESVLLASLGGVAGLLFAYWGKDLLLSLRPWGRTALELDLQLDWRVLGFTATVSVLTGILFGLAPALRASRLDLAPALKESARSVLGGGSRFSLRNALVISQVALSLVLLVGAGLFVRTLRNLSSLELGFNRENVLLFKLDPQLAGYKKEQNANLYQQVLERLAALPGAEQVSLSRYKLLSGSASIQRPFIEGHASPGKREYVYVNQIGANFLATMGIPLAQGRGLSPQDTHGAPKVALINQTLARRYFPNENPLGKRLGFEDASHSGELEIVGITQDAQYSNLRDGVPPTVYLPYLQAPAGVGAMNFVVRTAGDPQALLPAIRETLRALDKNLPLVEVKTQEQQTGEALAQERLFASLSSLFGVLALLLACLGLYGLMSYSVARRTNELGIRLALGARPRDVLWLILREALLLVSVGVALGLPAALGASRWVESLLFGLKPTDPITLTLATLLMLTVAAVAGYLPARRAARVDPLQALREE